MIDPLQILLGWLALVNLLAFLALAKDKHASKKRRRRVPERRLLWLAALGGMPGVFVAIHLFSHKTRKQPFRRWLFLILGVQIVGLGLLLAM
ncbi:Uncharacterized membrane protein YsdA, DUF1294 family [Roseovarius pacificus]|uniref:Uncharacterized membrane protein YsdA, DUF1294 family n=1 Tax=Roseovarius pacificus TaxID=337701 RepID=A0A1M7CDM4_9RHOB|nr:DUF1294 domain-containing protein [Roseovarius pacificus]GGO55592.1 hypothetical protein GCM10011315_18420 [Roseovarius pacificus]SHL64979.1 Uncharacterized membrane protein YsdA, DUF1294 family [Roseovarius pacificus]